ncbi:hypothetical protein [Rhodococcus sp. IEGM 1408]|uniref:hypothetical protein n=1 Tax=Rhodococcus sp. IEGM 1408 TaxID=3082220 RepID=UPI0029537616|nr:hypothetical protein [Rhodococcus sp. IEGM 1408]MDV8002847.1 hypothetical protein [Rhodococcus sp. IEGM 1408]
MKASLALAATAAALLLAATGCSSSDEPADSDGDAAAVDVEAAPTDLTWRTVGGLRVPVSRADGPAKTTPPEGYSHTPQGAALAAANAQAVLATATDDTWAETVRTVTAPGPGRDEFAFARTLMSVTGPVAAKDVSTFVGFKIPEYTPERAIVLLATRTPERNGQSLLTAYPVQTQWMAGDWKVVLPQQSDEVDAAELADLAQFTAWDEETS